jgi:Uma2 family endonuclease
VIGVSEIWIYDNRQLKIYLLQSDGYVESENSLVFPDFNIQEMLPSLLDQAFREGTSQMLRQLRS